MQTHKSGQFRGVGVRWGLDTGKSARGTPFFAGDALSNVQYAGKWKPRPLRNFSEDGTLIPASKLAETNDHELQRSRDFEASIEDEERHRKTATTAPEDKLKNLPLTRERFED